jgi:hypothetical protein
MMPGCPFAEIGRVAHRVPRQANRWAEAMAGSNAVRARQARSIVSCTTSSASKGDPSS